METGSSSGWYAIVADGFDKGQAVGTQTYQVADDTPLTGWFHIIYDQQNNAPLPMLALAILDEQQLEDPFAGASTPVYHAVFQPGDDHRLTLNIPPLEPGVHELIVVVVPDPRARPTSQYRSLTPPAAYRLTLLAGATTPMIPREYELLEPIRAGSWLNPLTTTGLVLSNTTNVRDGIPVWGMLPPPSVRRNGQLDFYAYVGYTGGVEGAVQPEANLLALLLFVDYEQVDLQAGVPVYYGEAPADVGLARIEGQVEASTPGRHEVLALRVNYPGFPMCLLRTTLLDRVEAERAVFVVP